MKKLFTSAAVLLLMASCNNGDKTESNTAALKDSTKTAAPDKKQQRLESNKQKAIASVTAFSNHDVEGTLKDEDPNAVDYGDGSMAPMKNMDSAKAMVTMFLKSFPDIKADNILALADGEYVSVFADWSATFKNDMGSTKATGKTTKFHDCDLFRFNDSGRIIEHRSVQNMSILFK